MSVTLRVFWTPVPTDNRPVSALQWNGPIDYWQENAVSACQVADQIIDGWYKYYNVIPFAEVWTPDWQLLYRRDLLNKNNDSRARRGDGNRTITITTQSAQPVVVPPGMPGIPAGTVIPAQPVQRGENVMGAYARAYAYDRGPQLASSPEGSAMVRIEPMDALFQSSPAGMSFTSNPVA